MTSRLPVLLLIAAGLTGCGPSDEEIALASKVAALEAQVDELGVEGQRLNGELEATAARADTLATDLAAARETVASQQSALAEAATGREALTARLQAARERSAMLADTVTRTRDTLVGERDTLAEALEASRQEAAELGARLAGTRGEVFRLENMLRETRNDLGARARSSESERDQAEQGRQELASRAAYLVGVLERERAAFLDDRDGLQQSLEEARAQAGRLGAQLAALRQQEQATTAEKAELARQKTALEATLAEARAKRREMAGEMERLRAEAAEVDPSLAAKTALYGERARILETQLGSLQERLEAAHARAGDLLRAVESCQRELSVQNRLITGLPDAGARL